MNGQVKLILFVWLIVFIKRERLGNIETNVADTSSMLCSHLRVAQMERRRDVVLIVK